MLAKGSAGRQLARDRDERTLAWVAAHRYATVQQIAPLVFGNIGWGSLKCQERLRVLAGRGLLARRYLGGRLVYYPAELNWSAKALHWIALGDFHVSLLTQAKWWQKLNRFDMEFAVAGLVVDALMTAQTTDGGELKKYFIEVERSYIPRAAEKAEKLTELYQKRGWEKEKWADLDRRGPRFARVLFIVAGQDQARELRQRVEELKSPLWIKVATMEEAKADAWGVLR